MCWSSPSVASEKSLSSSYTGTQWLVPHCVFGSGGSPLHLWAHSPSSTAFAASSGSESHRFIITPSCICVN